MSMLFLEEAALSAWPALQTIYYDGWLVRFAGGYTKRANSVNALYGSSLPTEEKITHCETLYERKALKPVFRMTPISTPDDLDFTLSERGYTLIDRTLVQTLNLDQRQNSRQYTLSSLDLESWLRVFCQLSRVDLEQHHTHHLMLKTIPSPCLFASISHDQQIVACGLGVLGPLYMGLFDLVTDPNHRGHGFGTTLVNQMLHWGERHGATRAYLQVMKTNMEARRVYERIGFQTRYAYWYRVPERNTCS